MMVMVMMMMMMIGFAFKKSHGLFLCLRCLVCLLFSFLARPERLAQFGSEICDDLFAVASIPLPVCVANIIADFATPIQNSKMMVNGKGRRESLIV